MKIYDTDSVHYERNLAVIQVEEETSMGKKHHDESIVREPIQRMPEVILPGRNSNIFCLFFCLFPLPLNEEKM